MTYEVLVVCGTGMGSSMILKMMVDQVVQENDLPLRVTSDLASSVHSSNADIFVAGTDLAPTLEGVKGEVVGVRNIMDKAEILAGLNAAIEAKNA